MDIYEALSTEYRQGIEPLVTEEIELQGRRSELMAAANPQHEQAKRNSLSRQIEDADAASSEKVATEKRDELQVLNAEVTGREEKLRRNNTRLEAIANEKTRIRKTAFDKNSDVVAQEARRIITDCCDQLEALREGILRYYAEAGLEITGSQLDRLTKVSHIGADRQLRAAMEKWL